MTVAVVVPAEDNGLLFPRAHGELVAAGQPRTAIAVHPFGDAALCQEAISPARISSALAPRRSGLEVTERGVELRGGLCEVTVYCRGLLHEPQRGA